MMEAVRFQTSSTHENASYESQSREQQLAHLQQTLKDLPTADSLAALLVPSAPPLEVANQENDAHISFDWPVIPSAPPLEVANQENDAHISFDWPVIPSAPFMEDSYQADAAFLIQPSNPSIYPSLQTHPTPSTKVFEPKSVPVITNDTNFTAEAIHICNKSKESNHVVLPPTAYYTNEESNFDCRATWPEHVLFNSNQKIGDRYAPDVPMKLYECVTSNNEKYLNLQGPKTLIFSNSEKTEVRQCSDEKKIHHMEFVQDGFRLKDYVPSSEPKEKKEAKWKNICQSSEGKVSNSLNRTSTFSKLSERFKSFFKVENKVGKRHLRLGGGKKAVFNKEIESLYGPTHNLDGFKDLMVMEQDEIDRVGTVDTQVNDNAVFHLAFQMVYDYNKALPKRDRETNHVRLLHPTFLDLFLQHGMSEKLSEMTAFMSEKPCSRYLVPFLRNNHFALVHVGKVEETYHMHVFDSLRPFHPSIAPSISDVELRKLARLLANDNVRTKITRVPEAHASMQRSAESNDCGICTIQNIHACLQNKMFPTNTALYEKWKVPDQVTTLNRSTFKTKLQNWIGNNNNINIDSTNNSSDTPSTSSKKQSIIAFARSQRKRKSEEPKPTAQFWKKQKERQDVIRNAVQKHRLEEKYKTLSSNEADVETLPELDSVSDHEQSTIDVTDVSDSDGNNMLTSQSDNFEKNETLSHKKKVKSLRGSQQDHQMDDVSTKHVEGEDSTAEAVNLTPSVPLSDEAVLGSLLVQVDKFLEHVQDRATRNLLKEFKEKLSTKLDGRDEDTDASISSEDTTISDYETDDEETIFDPKFWTERRKQNLIESYDNSSMSFKELKKRFHLSENDKSARVQIGRIRQCLTNKRWKKNEAIYHLAERVAGMTTFRDEQRHDIHESDIRRLAFEQSICYGLRHFKASRKFVEKIKGECSLVSRHVDGRLSKRALLRQSEIEQNIADFRNIVVPRIRNQYAVDQIYNVDQTGVVLEETKKRTLTKKGTPKVMRLCQRDNATTHSMTFNPCISADGKLKGKLFLTMHEPNPPRSFRQMVAPFRNLHVTHSKSGKMSSQLAEEWMEKCLLPNIPDGSVLLLDSWTGFNRMKLLRSVARKKLEIVTFPERTTSQLQPLDLFFNRQLKSFLRKLHDQIRLRMNDFTISIRNNLLKIASFTENQFEAPRFAPFIQRGFYELGIVTTRPPAFETPAEFCFNPEVGKNKCQLCSNLSFVKCAHCEKTYCIKCGLDHFH